jgi:biopolymer transport protein ExbD
MSIFRGGIRIKFDLHDTETAMAIEAPPPDVDELVGLEEVEEERPEALKPRRQLEDTEMDITPMIDITFLLLIFFLVASKMDESSPVPLPPAKYGLAVPTKNSVIITIGKGPSDDGPAAVYKGDGANADAAFDSGDLEAQEEEIATYVSDAMLEDTNKTFVLIKAARGVKHRDVSRVAKAVGKVAEVQQLHIAVLEEQ